MGSLPSYRKSTIPAHAKKVFEGVLFDVYQWDQTLYDGSAAVFEKLGRADTAVVFPILEDGRILLINEEQPGRIASHVAPSGRVEEGETPEETAKRELEEETGYRAETLVPLYEHSPASKIDWVIYAYIGKRCKRVAEAHPEAGERIALAPATFDELIQYTIEGDKSHYYGYFAKIVYDALLNQNKMKELREMFSND